jgi:hypothetical protein
MLLSILARVTVTFGSTNHFALLSSHSRVTKLLAQFGRFLALFKLLQKDGKMGMLGK